MQAVARKSKRYPIWLILIFVLALLTAGGVAYFQKSSTPVVSQATVVVGRGDVQTTVAATGSVSAVNSVDIGSRVTGLITEVRVQENEMVKKGQILVVLDDTAIRTQVAQYQAQVANYAAVYERTRKLAALGGESAQQLDSDQTNYLVAKANYDNYVTQLGYYVITAPIDGVVIGEPTPAGQTVVQGISEAQVLMTVADMSQMQVKVMVDETDIGKVKAGQSVSFTVDSYTDQTFTGKITRISKDATTSSNVVYYYAYVDVDSPQDLLYPTMTARAAIHVGESKNALVVPLSAIKEENGQKYVQVMVNGKPQNQPVQIGLSNDEQAEILSGIHEGDQVVLPAAKTPTANAQNQGPPPPL